ncbi:HAD family phosphatase [Kitasatospora sp. NPDC048540]|uniref:HAD family hydrolase n=1 Tax=unclassified Kitasatospora TaxID=2633591 RepID=UPI000AE6CB8C|nr:HAD family phosphatase [Kitasatospora sp. MBT63]
MKSIELVIFDNDGVLVDSERLANTVLAELLTEVGIPTTLDQSIRDYMGGSFARVRQLAEERAGFPLPEDFGERFQQRLSAVLRTGLEPMAGARAVLEALAARGTRCCVASSSDPERLALSLDVTGLAPLVQGRVFSAAEVAAGKPAPDLFQYAAAQMGVDPAAALVVEDSELGVRAARAAGMRVIGFAAVTPPERLAAADHVIRDLALLPSMLNDLAAE